MRRSADQEADYRNYKQLQADNVGGDGGMTKIHRVKKFKKTILESNPDLSSRKNIGIESVEFHIVTLRVSWKTRVTKSVRLTDRHSDLLLFARPRL